MSDKSSIEWTNATWNPLRGTIGRWHCVRISGGCKHCYAARMNHRFHGPDYIVGADTPRLDEKALTLPLRWRDPRKVFACSMTDLFLDEHPDEWIDRVFAVMALAPRHTFQVLTKRPERMRAWATAPGRHNAIELAADSLRPGKGSPAFGGKHMLHALPIPNVWLGVSVEDQATADARVPLLLQTPAAVRFVSYEPALGPVDFESLGQKIDPVHAKFNALRGGGYYVGQKVPDGNWRGTHIDWLIVGGESGPGARTTGLGWIRDTVMQCRRAGVAVFVKQVGARVASGGSMPDKPRDRKGGDMAEWPEDLRVREFPAGVTA